MSIEDKIQEIAETQFGGFSYCFEDWYDADAKLEKMSFPAILLIMPLGGSVAYRNGKAYDTENVGLCFLDKAPRGAEGEDNKKIYTRMKAEGTRFLQAINDSGYFTPLQGEQPYDLIYEQLSTIVSGVMYTLTLKQLIGECL